MPVRVVTAASLFDGHDASINIMRRLLQKHGCEVVHLGHNRSVDEVVTAVVQEDPHGVAISSYQGGHVEYFTYLVDRLREEGYGHVEVFGGGGGVIVNVSSAATRGIHRIPYSAAKGGINALTASLALEYADAGIRVVATAPGGTEAPPRRISRGTPAPRDDRERQWFQAHIDQTLEHSLMHRYGTLEEQAAAICFLASGEASYITGTVLPVAGGDLG